LHHFLSFSSTFRSLPLHLSILQSFAHPHTCSCTEGKRLEKSIYKKAIKKRA
jgi:hypothetical protein